MSENITTSTLIQHSINDPLYYNSHFFLKVLTFLFTFMYSIQILLLVVSILFIFNGNLNVSSVNNIIRSFSCYKGLMYLNLINLAALIGIPPLSGFLLKFLILNNVLLTGHYIEFFFLFTLILISMGIYLQITRLFKNSIILNEADLLILKKNNNSKYKFYLVQVLGIFFILFFFIFFKDFIILFSIFFL